MNDKLIYTSIMNSCFSIKILPVIWIKLFFSKFVSFFTKKPLNFVNRCLLLTFIYIFEKKEERKEKKKRPGLFNLFLYDNEGFFCCSCYCCCCCSHIKVKWISLFFFCCWISIMCTTNTREKWCSEKSQHLMSTRGQFSEL